MNTMTKIKSLGLTLALAFAVPASALNILLTNDDGWDSEGIHAMKTALVNAGHTVTLVAPLNEQSGKGGSLNTGVFSAVVSVTEAGGPGSNEWAVDSSPADAVRAAFGLGTDGVLAGVIPDLVISGINEGQNLGMSGSWGSGTVNAALQGMHFGVPAIAVSAERLLISSSADTVAAYPGIADFVVRLVQRLEDTAVGGELLPRHHLLNVNYPVFNSQARPGVVKGVRMTNLAEKSNLEIIWSGNPAVTGTMNVVIDFPQTSTSVTDPIPHNDTDALKAGYASVTLMNGDMTAKRELGVNQGIIAWRLWGLQP